MRLLFLLATLALLFAVSPVSSYSAPLPDTPTPPLEDALIAPPPSATLSFAADQRGPSQYMAGTVAVRLVLPESNGDAESNREDWSEDEIALVTAQVRDALSWWEARLPMARLNFMVHVDRAVTAYEPIKHGLADEGLWISDSLASIGFQGTNHFDQVYAAGDALRDELHTDWTTTIFVVDSSAHPTGYFADGYFAYAYINGPYMVLTSDVGGYGINRMAPVVAHELGHIFGALDQYAAARVPCERRSGYLHAPTSNSQYGGCGGRAPSIMLEPVGAFASGIVDASARAQVGYSDSDGDGRIDPLDTTPTLSLNADNQIAQGKRPIISGSAQDLPFPTLYQQQVTLNTIAAIEYRVDDDTWLPFPPGDGAYDEAVEFFNAELPLYDGTYTLEVRARNSAGGVSASAVHSLVVSGVGPAPTYASNTPPISASPSVTLSLTAPVDTLGVQVSEDPAFAAASWQPYAAELPLALTEGDGVYTLYVRFQDASGLASLPLALNLTLDTAPPSGTVRRDPASATTLLLSATDATSGVTAVEVQVGAATPAWRPYTERIELGAGSEGQAITLRLRDAAGNLSAPVSAPSHYVVALPLIQR